MNQELNPEKPARWEAVDAVRGLALGGMLVANLGIFSGTGWAPLPALHGIDRAAALTSRLLVQGKFYPLFAFLFGWTLAVQSRTRSRQYQIRRLTLLGLIGGLHAILLWSGDILLSYAVLGLLVVTWGEAIWRRRRLFYALFSASLLLASLLALPGIGKNLHADYVRWISPVLERIGQPVSLASAPPASYPQAILDRLRTTIWKLAYFPDWWGDYLAVILLGFVAGKEAWLQRLAAQPGKRMLKLAGSALLAGLALNGGYVAAQAGFWFVPPAWRSFSAGLLESLGGPVLAGAYVLIVLSVWERLRSNRWLRGLSGMGRMSLSHYLGQSLACGFLCYPYGLGWYAKISPAGIWLLAAAIFLLQGGFSWFWLKRFRVGPLEAVWRWGAGRYRALSQEIPPSTAVIPFIRSQQQEQS